MAPRPKPYGTDKPAPKPWAPDGYPSLAQQGIFAGPVPCPIPGDRK